MAGLTHFCLVKVLQKEFRGERGCFGGERVKKTSVVDL